MEIQIKVSNRNEYGERYHARITTQHIVSELFLNRINNIFEEKTNGYSLYKVSDFEIGIIHLDTQSKSFTIPYPASKMVKTKLNEYLELAKFLLKLSK